MRMSKGLSDPPRRFDGPPKQKRAVNLSVDAELLAVARGMNINLSRAFEETLRNLTKEERIRQFQEEHREAFEAHNRFIEKHGIWSKKYRTW
jgi:antitoxin CcdA